MKFSKLVWPLGAGIFSVALLAGCGTTSSTSTPSQTSTPPSATAQKSSSGTQKNSTYVLGGAPYQGQKNLKSWEQKAKSDPTNVKNLYGAGVSAYLNNQPQLSVHYYEMAAKLQPKNGMYLNNIGNVYRNSLHDNQTAIQYYKKATTVDPTYDYGWYNWAYTLMQENQVAQAKSVVAAAQKALPKSDKLYKPLGELVNTSTKAKTKA